jgi:hypothetical protein
MSRSTSTTLTFPPATLQPLQRELYANARAFRHLANIPTHANQQLLQRELYTDAHAIHSTRGGGAHGHLAIIMPPADYLNRLGQAFDLPIHPDTAPKHITHKAI